MRRILAGVGGALVALLVAAELAAVPLAERIIGSAVASCVPYESLSVERVARPVVPRLLLGRARDVVLVGEGLRVGPLRVDHVRLEVPQAVLPWALGSPDPGRAVIDVRLTERDVERALREFGPFGLDLTVELEPDVATVGTRQLPLSVRLEMGPADGGGVRVRPVAGDAEWWDRLGLYRDVDPPPDVQVTAADIGDGRLTGTVEVTVLPAVGGAGRCEEPLA